MARGKAMAICLYFTRCDYQSKNIDIATKTYRNRHIDVPIAQNYKIIISTLFNLAVSCYLKIVRACKFVQRNMIYINVYICMLTCDLNLNLTFNWWNFRYFLSSEIAKTIFSFWICEALLLFLKLLLGKIKIWMLSNETSKRKFQSVYAIFL